MLPASENQYKGETATIILTWLTQRTDTQQKKLGSVFIKYGSIARKKNQNSFEN